MYKKAVDYDLQPPEPLPKDPEDGSDTEIILEGIGSIAFERGFYCANGKGGTTYEPDVFYIESINVIKHHQGYGKKLLAQALEKAKAEGFELSRMIIINPIVVRRVEELRAEALIKDVVYTNTPSLDQAEIPSNEAFKAPVQLSAQLAEASAQAYQEEYARSQSEDRDQDPNIPSVDCVMRI